MKPLYLSFLLFVPFAFGARYYFVCDTLHWCGRTTLARAASARVTVGAPDEDVATLELPAYRAGEAALPMSSPYEEALDALARLTAAQPDDYALAIAAPVLPTERRGVPYDRFADIGLARAAALSADLQDRGVPAERMRLRSYAVTDENSPATPRLRFERTVAKSLGTGLAPAELLADSMAFTGLRFGRNSTALEPDSAFAAYAEKLVATLNADTALRLRLIGHTDDRANATHNDTLGRWRAEAVAAYLEQRGLSAPVTVESRGATEPAADNATAEGRYLNRRVEARIE